MGRRGKFLQICACALLCVLFLSGTAAANDDMAALPRQVLTNEGLLILARAGVSDLLLVDLVRQKRTYFDTSASALAELSRHGISEAVIRAVVEKQDQVQLRPQKLVVTPLSAHTAVAAGSELLIVPGQPVGKRQKTEPDRWYKVSLE